MNKPKNKKRMIALMLSVLMLISLFQNISYAPIAESNASQQTGEIEGVQTDTDAGLVVSESEPQQQGLGAAFEQAQQSVAEAAAKDLLTDAGAVLDDLTLKGVYKDAEGTTHVVTFTKGGEVTIPGDADINMNLNFCLKDGNTINGETSYVYRLPDTVRVDVEAEHELTDRNGQSIGKVKIAKDGTLTFQFYEERVKNNHDIPFYVRFDGKFSSELSEGGKKGELVFPAGDTSFSYGVDVTEPTSKDPTVVYRDYGISKSGTVTTNAEGKKVIRWTIQVCPQGRKDFNGTVVDILPEGLTYAGNVTVRDMNSGSVTPKLDGNILSFEMKDCNTYYAIKIDFDTEIDPSYGGQITNSSVVTKENQATFNPEDTQDNTVTSDKTTVRVTPEVLSKSGVNDGGVITWTVKINADRFDLANSTYTDTIGAGQELISDSFRFVSPAGANASIVTPGGTNGFVIDFGTAQNETYYEFTYQTRQTDWTATKLNNTGKLDGGNFNNYTKNAEVPGVKLIEKQSTAYDDIMHTLTWKIVVNPQSFDSMGTVSVSDTFPAMNAWINGTNTSFETMELVSVTREDTGNKLNVTDTGNGFTYSFAEGELDGTSVTLTVVTKLKDTFVEQFNENWCSIKNQATLTSSKNPTTPATAEAERSINVKKTSLLEKTGEIQSDGTIMWQIEVKASTLHKEKIVITDTLSANQIYVAGSSKIARNTWQFGQSYDVYEREPQVTELGGKQVLTYTFDSADSLFPSNYYDTTFYIRYYTKADITVEESGASLTYDNTAKAEIDFTGDITMTDEKTAGVTGQIGGVIDKTASYVGNHDYVDWTVMINKPGYDLSAALNPRITDTLASYFDYTKGKLYEVQADGSEVEVASSSYIVTVVNQVLTVQLPTDENGKYMGTKTYAFRFQTRFNCLAAELPSAITNAVSFHGLADTYSKTSDELKNVYFSSSSAGSSTRQRVRIKKVDSVSGTALKDAVFEIYAGTVKIASVQTDAEGYAVFENLTISDGMVLKIYETVAPDGYLLPDSDVSVKTIQMSDFESVSIVNGTQTVDVTIPNTKITTTVVNGSILLEKQDADVPAGKLAGAEFTLYNELPTAASTGLARLTDADGKVQFTFLEAGTAGVPKVYYVVETKAPDGYLQNDAAPIVVKASIDEHGVTTYEQGTISGGSFVPDVTVTTPSVILNKKTTATCKLLKVNQADTTEKLSGAKFALYEDAQCTNLVASQITGADGVAEFTGLELGKTYYYREEVAPSGYVLDNSIHTVTIGTGTENAIVVKEITVENEKQNGSIRVKKVDNAIPANPIAGISFRLHKDSATGAVVQIPENGSMVDYVVTTNASGEATFENLPYGTYYVEELSTGLPAKYELAAAKEVQVVSNGVTDVTIVNTVKKFQLRVVKVDKDDTTKQLSGATFTLYSSTGVKLAEKTTGVDGTIEFSDLPYDSYYITELTTPAGYNAVGSISFSSADFVTPAPTGSYWTADWDAATQTYKLTVSNEKQKGKIVLKKTDKDGNPLAGAEFTLYKDNLELKTAVSDASGAVTFTELAYGVYTVKETKAPTAAGKTYIMDTKIYTVEVVSDTENKYESNTVASANSLFTVRNEEQLVSPPNISFKLKKLAKDAGAVQTALENAVFGFYEIEAGGTEQLLATATSDADGMVYFRKINIEACLSDSQFVIRELTAPAGYQKAANDIVLAEQKSQLNVYADEENALGAGKADADILWILAKTTAAQAPTEAIVVNEQIYGSIYVKKTSAYDGSALKDAEFTLYKEDGTTIVSGFGITNPQITDATGTVVFTNLPLGTYIVKETKAPKGYVVTTKTQTVVVNDETMKSCLFKDDRIDLSISKLALGGSTEIQGAHLELRKQADNTLIKAWTSTTTPQKLLYSQLETGVEYVLTETAAPNGYGCSKPIVFTITESGTIEIKTAQSDANASVSGQTLVMRDAPITILVEKVDDAAVPAGLPNATLAVIAADTQRELERFTTTGTAYALDMSKLSIPTTAAEKKEYRIREISAPDGYEIAEDVAFAIDWDGKVWTKDNSGNYTVGGTTSLTIRMVDKKKTNGTIYIQKLKTTGETLSGAGLAIYKAADDITTATPIVSFVSTNVPKAILVDDFGTTTGTLKAGESYKLVETAAPAGYLLAETITFTVTKDATNQYKITTISDMNSLNNDKVTLMMRDKPLSLKIRKETGAGDLLAGATLKLYEGDVVDETKLVDAFTTNQTNVHVVEFTSLKANQTYLLVETAAPNGFLLAGNIRFTIGADGQIQKQSNQQTNGTWTDYSVYDNTIVMTDDEEAITICKIASDSNQILAGAVLKLESVVYGSYGVGGYDAGFTTRTFTTTIDAISLDANQFHPGCVYSLSEVTAPNGYAFAEPVVFLYTSDHKVQYLTSTNTGADRTVYMYDKPILLTIDKKNIYSQAYVEQAKLQIVDKAGNVITSWTTGNRGNEVGRMLQAPQTGWKEYILQETQAPTGYSKAEDIPFAVNASGAIYTQDANGNYTVEVTDGKITMYDEPQLQVSKEDAQGTAIGGATLEITKQGDASFTPIRWTSSADAPKLIDVTGLEKDVVYVLTETQAPDGYAYADAISFKILADGTIEANGETVQNHTIVMKDAALKVKVQKKDAESKRHLPGAKLAIFDANGTVLYEFVSGMATTVIPSEIFKAPKLSGEYSYYTLREIAAPYGYALADPITFAFDSHGQLYIKSEEGTLAPVSDAIVMEDIPYYITVSKVDASTGEELDGAKLEIRDDSNQVVLKWTSSKKDGSKKLAVAQYLQEGRSYTLVETEAPKGYEVAEPIVFRVDKDGIVYLKNEAGGFDATNGAMLVMEDEVKIETSIEITTETGTDTSTTTSVKTGDSTPMIPVLGIMIGAALGIIVLGIRRKKENL